MDPLTIIVTALAAGAAAGLKPTAAQIVKDTYEGLKAFIKRKYARVSVDVLENDPADPARRTVVRQDLEQTEAAGDAELLRQAQAMLDVVQREAPEAAAQAGVDLEDVKVAASLTIEDILTGSHTGVRGRHIDVGGDMNIRGVRAGGGHGDPSNPEGR